MLENKKIDRFIRDILLVMKRHKMNLRFNEEGVEVISPDKKYEQKIVQAFDNLTNQDDEDTVVKTHFKHLKDKKIPIK